jgi:hypothetical protein
MKKILIIFGIMMLTSVGMVSASFCDSYPDALFCDDAETGNPSSIGWAIHPILGSGNITYSPGYGESNSTAIAINGDYWAVNVSGFYNNLNLSFDAYDDGTTFAIGVTNNQTDWLFGASWMYESQLANTVYGAASWNGNVQFGARTPGWHHFNMVIDLNYGIDVYIDDVFAGNLSEAAVLGEQNLVIYGYNEGGNTYFDNLLLTGPGPTFCYSHPDALFCDDGESYLNISDAWEIMDSPAINYTNGSIYIAPDGWSMANLNLSKLGSVDNITFSYNLGVGSSGFDFCIWEHPDTGNYPGFCAEMPIGSHSAILYQDGVDVVLLLDGSPLSPYDGSYSGLNLSARYLFLGNLGSNGDLYIDNFLVSGDVYDERVVYSQLSGTDALCFDRATYLAQTFNVSQPVNISKVRLKMTSAGDFGGNNETEVALYTTNENLYSQLKPDDWIANLGTIDILNGGWGEVTISEQIYLSPSKNYAIVMNENPSKEGGFLACWYANAGGDPDGYNWWSETNSPPTWTTYGGFDGIIEVLGNPTLCSPDWVCSQYNACEISNTKTCYSAVDLNVCGSNYTGNGSELIQSCVYPTPPAAEIVYVTNSTTPENVTDLIISPTLAVTETTSKIDFTGESIDVTNIPEPERIIVTDTLVSIDIVANPELNKPATIRMGNVDPEYRLYYDTGYNVEGTNECTAPRCTNIVYNPSTRVLTFDVSGFSSYYVGNNYKEEDLPVIIVDGIGIFFASIVSWVELIVLAVILLYMGNMIIKWKK